MHTSGLRSQEFEIAVGGQSGTLTDVFPGFDAEDRLGIVVHQQLAAAGAGNLILAAITAFYDQLRATGEPFFAYPDYFAFHVAADRGTLYWLDVYPGHKEVVVANDAELIAQAINDRGVTRLLVPEPQPPGPAVEPDLERETRHSARRRIRSALVYSPTGQTAGADVLVRGSAHSDAYIDAMLGNPARETPEPQPAQSFRRMDPHQALGLLLAPPG
ncbi:MAG TPA: hypothetical protein VGF68_11300 [Solirubrobacteraceae bacterium]